MSRHRVSVIVVSRGRPEQLKLCLLAVSQLRFERFEIVVVADQQGLDAIRTLDFSGQIKSANCDVANISLARNIGLTLAAGDVVAFLDDDSMPEPGWLHHLVAVFDDEQVVAAGGYVLGRNGISFQSMAQSIDNCATTRPIEIAGSDVVVKTGSAALATKTVGTNCAFRRSVFETIGGFDPAFPYFLDESDINLRVGGADLKTAIVPLALVHHQTSASDIRDKKRVPISLYKIGRSTAIFLRKHCPKKDRVKATSLALWSQRDQLSRMIKNGRCRPRKAEHLIQTMRDGLENGAILKIQKEPRIDKISHSFQKFEIPNRSTEHKTVSGFRISGRETRKRAADLVNAGHVVSLFLFSRTGLYHHVRFHPDGYWEQTGGLFGRSRRTDALIRWVSLGSRVDEEAKRVAIVRHPWNIG